MKTYAHIADGTIREMITLDSSLVPGKDLFTEAFAADLVDVTQAAPRPAEGWTYDGKTFAPPILPPTPPRAASTWDLMSALTTAQRALYPSLDPWDQRLFQARIAPWPEDDLQIARMADVLKTSPEAWFDAALKGAAP